MLISLEKEHGKKLRKLAEERPHGTQIYLHHGMDVTARVALPLPDRTPVKDLLNRYFDPSGLLVGSPLLALPSLLAAIENLAARERPLVNLTEAVREHLALLQDREEVAQQKEWFLDQVKRGRRIFDVLSTKLYPYQEQGAMHLAFGRRAMLADDMGLGKTVQAIAAAALLKEMRDIQKVVTICPASLKHQWAREIRRFTSLSVTVVEGNLEARRDHYRDSSFFKIINYELVERGHLPAELSQRLSQVRDLTAQPEVGEEAVPLSAQTGKTLLEFVRELVELAREQTVKMGL